MATTPLPLEAEEFLAWMLAEKGRSANTLAAYRRDLRSYWHGSTDQHTDVLSVDHETLVGSSANARPPRLQPHRSPGNSPRSACCTGS